MNAFALLEKHFDNKKALDIVYQHSRAVADKALAIAKGAGLPSSDLGFIGEAALLHDIGVSRVNAPGLHCYGKAPYICHGIIGKEILEAEGLPLHALVCERHIGVGLTAHDIVRQQLPLPLRDMSPQSACERIVALADLFYSKKGGELDREKTTARVRSDLLRFGEEKVEIFERWLSHYNLEPAAL